MLYASNFTCSMRNSWIIIIIQAKHTIPTNVAVATKNNDNEKKNRMTAKAP